MEYKFTASQFLPLSLDKAWQFFSSPENLALITPPEMEFRLLSGKEFPIYEGLQIDYIIRPIGGIPFRWKTEIGKTLELQEFTDIQLKGPYSKWVHRHTFTPSGKGTLMTDEVVYRLPLGFFGDLLNSIFIRKKIEYIFNYRKKALIKLFGKNDSA